MNVNINHNLMDMKQSVTIVLTVLLGLLIDHTTSGLPARNQYRKDYVYNEQTDAFYKLHIESRIKSWAKKMCALEGGELMVPRSQADISQAHSMLKQYPDIGPVMVGNEDIKNEVTEALPTNLDMHKEDDYTNYDYGPSSTDSSGERCEVLTIEGDIESAQCYSPYPFVCKVDGQNAPYDSACDVYANGYKYYESTGSCYGTGTVAITWNEAYEECSAQKAHLLVVNSEDEQQAVLQFLRTTPRVETPWSAAAIYYFLAGIRRPENGTEFKTIFNQTLAEAGYSTWDTGEPNNRFSREFCGSVVQWNVRYNDVECDRMHPFVCETERNAHHR